MKDMSKSHSLVYYVKPWVFCNTAGIPRLHLSKLIESKTIDSAIMDKKLYIPLELNYISRSIFGIDPEDFKEDLLAKRPQMLLPNGGLFRNPNHVERPE
jgi:hypothetical protein